MANPTPKTSSTRVQLPVGLSGAEPPNAPEGGLAYATDTELVRVKTSTGWEDVGSGGGGGSITSIVEGPGIDITGGTGPVVTVSVDPSEISLVGDANGPLDANTVNAIHETSGPTKLTIGNINDFQLLQRVGATVVGTAYPPTTLVGDVNGPLISNQVNAIHETSGPTQLTIGSIAAGQVLQRVGNTVVGVAGGLPSGNPYVDPPLVPGALDDEFDSGSPDLALRGWLVYNASNAVMSRVGDVQPWNVSAASLTNTQYLSTIIGSQIMIQMAPGGEMRIVKSVPTGFAAGSGALVWGRIGCPVYNTGLSSSAYASQLAIFYAVGGLPDTANEIFVQGYSAGTSASYRMIQGFNVGGAQTLGSNRNSDVTNADIRGVKLKSGTNNWTGFYGDVAGNTVSCDLTALTSTTFRFAGFNLVDITTGTGAPNSYTSRIWSIDFFRSASGASAWIGQTPKVSVTGTYAGLPSGNPYIDPPAVANSFDDEFETGSADLATRGWTVKNSAGTTLTRSGDVDAWNATGPAAGTYWSTLRGSQLIVQFPPISSVYSIFKPISTLTTGDIYFARAGSAARLDSSAASGFFDVGLYANASGVPDTNNRVYVSTYGGANGAWYADLLRTTANVNAGTSKQPLGAATPDIRGVQYVGPSTYHPFMTNSANGQTFSNEPAGAVAGSTIAYAGFQWLPDITYAGSIPFVISIDFFRKVTTGQGIAQNPRPVLWNVVNGDIGVCSPKTTPVLADQVYVADSSASNAIRRSNLREIAVAGGTMYEAYPTTTDSWSDEFDEGSSDPTVRGWSLVQISPTISAMTRLGDVDPFIVPPTAMAAGQYRSTVRNGKLYVQVGGNSGNILYMYKATTAGAFVYASGASCSAFGSSTLRGIYITDSVSVPFGNAAQKSVIVTQDNTGTGNAYKQTGATQTSYASQALGAPYSPLMFFADWKGSGTNLVDCIITGLDSDALFLFTVNNAAPTTWAPGFAGAVIRNTPQFTLARNWIIIDYIRRYPTATWFPV